MNQEFWARGRKAMLMRVRKMIALMALLGCWAMPGVSREAAAPGLSETPSFSGFVGHLIEARNCSVAARPQDELEALDRAASALARGERSTQNAVLHRDFQNLLVREKFDRMQEERGGRVAELYEGLTKGTSGGFYQHLHEAIDLHEDRMPEYARRTKGLSDPLFKRIGLLQKLNLPVAWYIDLKARRFQKQGIPIICGDLVSMKGIKPANTPPKYRGKMSPATLESVRKRLKDLQKEICHLLPKNQFGRLAGKTGVLIKELRALEKSEKAHLAMTLHLLESIGYLAANSERYLAESEGKTAGLSRLFLTIQALPLQECVKTDRDAQIIHGMGVGVIVNDVPPIPFPGE